MQGVSDWTSALLIEKGRQQVGSYSAVGIRQSTGIGGYGAGVDATREEWPGNPGDIKVDVNPHLRTVVAAIIENLELPRDWR